MTVLDSLEFWIDEQIKMLKKSLELKPNERLQQDVYLYQGFKSRIQLEREQLYQNSEQAVQSVTLHFSTRNEYDDFVVMLNAVRNICELDKQLIENLVEDIVASKELEGESHQ